MRKLRLLIITDNIEKWMKEIEIENPEEKMISHNKAFISYGALCVDIVSYIEPRYIRARHYDKIICDKALEQETEDILRSSISFPFIYTDLGLMRKIRLEEDEGTNNC